MQNMKKSILGAVLALGLVSTSCLGPNNAWENLHKWNRTMSDSKWANEGVFILLTVIRSTASSIWVTS
jgi:hypothetical protein